MPEQKVTVGRIVHYVIETGRHLPAIVTDVHNDGTEGYRVNLFIFWDPAIPRQYNLKDGVIRCPHDEKDKQPDTWHWPERS